MCFCSSLAHFWIRPSTKTASEFATNVELHIGITHQKRLSIGVNCNELNAAQTGKKRVQGVELGATGELARNWLISAGYTYMDTSIESGRLLTANGDNALTYTPKQSFNLWTSYQLPMGVKIGGGARFNDKLLRGTDGAVGTPKYSVPAAAA